jgi:hypothetical protein
MQGRDVLFIGGLARVMATTMAPVMETVTVKAMVMETVTVTATARTKAMVTVTTLRQRWQSRDDSCSSGRQRWRTTRTAADDNGDGGSGQQRHARLCG